MVVNMEAEQTKEKVLQLIKDKDKIEEEIKDLRAILESNRVGMEEPLVDSEGFPRQDIDVYQVRHARHKIICLQNDHINLMKQIEDGLHNVHSLSKNDTEQPTSSTTYSEETEIFDPFLRVNLVSPESPAEIAGIQVEDLILEFGFISSRNFKSLKDIGDLVENSRYKPVHIKIKRKFEIVVLTVVPRPWSGKGLLGCNVVPLEVVER